MSGPHPLADLPGLHIRAGDRFHPPTADYWCGRCGFRDAASGDAVRAFVATIQRIHRAECPNTQKGTQP
jgi:hypothetical protein